MTELFWSGTARVVLILATVAATQGCVSAAYIQDIQPANYLRPGMTLQEAAIAMAAQPLRAEFKGALTEWHYCKTGTAIGSVNDHVTLFFRDGTLVETRYYSAEQVGNNCTSTIKGGNYRDPDWVAELRLKP